MAGSAQPLREEEGNNFLPPLPKALGGGSRKRGATELKASFGSDISSIEVVHPEKKASAAPPRTGGAVVTPFKAIVDPKARRSDGIQGAPPPGAPPLPQKTASPSIPEDDGGLESIDIGSLEAVDLSQDQAPAGIAAPPEDRLPEIQREMEKEAAAPERSRESTFFSSSFATPVELDRTLIEKYEVEWLRWTPETLWQTIRMDWNTQISRINMEKMNAVMLLHVSDSFWRHWETFEKVVLAFNNQMPLFDRRQEPTVGQMLHAVLQASQIRKEAFEPEVLSYIALVAREEGFLWLPSPLDVAQPRLDSLLPAHLSEEKKEIRERWDALRGADLRSVELKEDVYGVHLARLAAIEAYLESMSSPELPEEAT